MSDAAAAGRRAPGAKPGRWFEKPGASPADKIPAFREALHAVAAAWQERFRSLAAVEGEISFTDVTVCRVGDVPGRRGAASVLAALQAPGWKTRVGVNFDRVFVTTMVEALFGGAGEDVGASAGTPLSPVDRQIAELTVRHVADALGAGFARCLPSPFHSEGLLPKFDPGFLGKPAAAVVVGTLALATLDGTVELDVLVPLAAMMVFADELAIPADADPTYEDPRWTQRLEVEVGRAVMHLTATIDLHPMELGAVAAFAEGQLIELPKGAGGQVRLSCGADDLFGCELGQSAGFYTVRVEQALGPVPAASEPASPSEPSPAPEPISALEPDLTLMPGLEL
jgi:flagellar motor switch protein FliM